MAKPTLVEGWKTKLDRVLHEKNFFTDQLEKIEQKTGIKRLHFVLGLIAVTALWLMTGYGAQFLCNFLGFAYPAYASVKAIESKEKDDDTKWLTYWVVFSFFMLLEFFADIFLFWIPFYWLFKCMFLIYCMAPTSWNGSVYIYSKVIRPFVLKHQREVDEALDHAGAAARHALEEARQAGIAKINATAKDVAQDMSNDVLKHQLETAADNYGRFKDD